MLPCPIFPLAIHARFGQNVCDAFISSVVLIIHRILMSRLFFNPPWTFVHRFVGSYREARKMDKKIEKIRFKPRSGGNSCTENVMAMRIKYSLSSTLYIFGFLSLKTKAMAFVFKLKNPKMYKVELSARGFCAAEVRTICSPGISMENSILSG